MAVSEGEKSTNDIIINDTMRDDDDVPPRYLFSHIQLVFGVASLEVIKIWFFKSF